MKITEVVLFRVCGTATRVFVVDMVGVVGCVVNGSVGVVFDAVCIAIAVRVCVVLLCVVVWFCCVVVECMCL